MTCILGSRQEWTDAAGFSRSPAVVICYIDRYTKAKKRIDSIVVTRTKRHRFTVHARRCLARSETARGRVWKTLAAHGGLRSGTQVVSAVADAASVLGIKVNWTDVVEQLSRLDWCLATVAANQHSLAWPDLDEASMRAVVDSLSPGEVEQVFVGVAIWSQPHMLPLLRHLHEKCASAGGRSASAWRRVENRLFGDPTRIVDGAFEATLMDGPSVNLVEVAGLPYSDELHDAVWGSHNWHPLCQRDRDTSSCCV